MFLYLLCTEHQNLSSSSKLRTFLGSKDFVASSNNLRSVFKGVDMVLWLGLELGLRMMRVRVRVRGLVGMIRVRVRG